MLFYLLIASLSGWAFWQVDTLPESATLLGAVVVSAPAALLAWITRTVTGTGALAGLACALLIYAGAYLGGTLVLGVALVLTVVSTQVGRARKQAPGLTEDGDGRREIANVLANCWVGALAAFLSESSEAWRGETALLMFITAIAAGASDSVASEIGKAYGGTARAFPTFRRVTAGTPGAITMLGTSAGIVAAAIIAWPAVLMWLTTWSRVPLIVASCTVAAFVESLLATWFERAGKIDNHTLNFINTATAALLIGLLA